MILENWHSAEDKARWKLVSTTDYRDIPGEIVSANETTGDYTISIGGETKQMSAGSGGIRIAPRRR